MGSLKFGLKGLVGPARKTGKRRDQIALGIGDNRVECRRLACGAVDPDGMWSLNDAFKPAAEWLRFRRGRLRGRNELSDIGTGKKHAFSHGFSSVNRVPAQNVAQCFFRNLDL